jgi:hypothetical protein
MDHRRVPPLIRRLKVAAAVVLAGCGPVGARAPQSAAQLRAEVVRAPRDERLSVVWVFSEADLLACEPPSPLLRRLQERLGDRVRVSALFVGAQRPEYPRAFLRSERLAVPVRQIGAEEFQRTFPHRRTPLVVTYDGARRTVFEQDTWRRRKPGFGHQLEDAVMRMAMSDSP